MAVEVARQTFGGVAETIIDLIAVDLSDLSQLTAAAEAFFGAAISSSPADRVYSKIIFINNAGTLGPLSFIGAHSDVLPEMNAAFGLNVTSACFLTSELVRRQTAGLYSPTTKVVIVNVSSLAALQPFDSWSIYCAGKAAREMYHKVLAEESAKRGGGGALLFRVLNYAPGPLDTDMQMQIREGPMVHKETQEYFKEMHATGKLVDPVSSATRLARIVLMEAYSSGAHVDFFDAIAEIDSPLPTTCCACPVCTCGPDCQCKTKPGKPQCSTCLSASKK